jgi:hypothetical protein
MSRQAKQLNEQAGKQTNEQVSNWMSRQDFTEWVFGAYRPAQPPFSVGWEAPETGRRQRLGGDGDWEATETGRRRRLEDAGD